MSERRFGEVSALLGRFPNGDPTRNARRRWDAASRYLVRVKQWVASGSNERAATIEGLERTLDDERDKAAALQRMADSLAFQTEVLERSYTTQLEEARLRAEEAERSLAERNVELIDLTAKYELATESQAGTRGELQRVISQRDRLRRQIDGEPEPDVSKHFDGDMPEGTIDRLMAAASRARMRSNDAAPASADSDAGSKDLLAPELLLSDKTADDS